MINESKDKIIQWAAHAHNLLVGICSHGCAYCYAPNMDKVHAREIEHETGGQKDIEANSTHGHDTTNQEVIDELK